MMPWRPILLALVAAVTVTSAAPIPQPADNSTDRSCNGHPSLCSKRYSDVVYIGAHNSYSWGQGISSDQTATVSEQLRAGVRLLQNQAHDFPHPYGPDYTNPSNIHLCHTSCYLLDGGGLEAYLSPVRVWLADNPNEVLTILLTNPDGLNITRFDQALRFNHLHELAYVPPKAKMTHDDWPTLEEMIDSGRRLVVFIDSGADQKRVPYILDEFSQVYENPYDQLGLPLNCSHDRGSDPANSLFLLNNTKDKSVGPISVPDKASVDTVNSANGPNGIVQTVQRCAKEEGGKKATFVLVE
ncbi:hypothetical protein BDZ90DRAFT_239634 [Jaminaea rosea]|uniref:PLC-like phosphodiesterase n=1 Tax=Jaminaea rosea TaxID=1569628 RepID=A0A316USE5_9BASI|nr:hypothetical protein BDZ90DRAFT_239634 [Jaminaea rosea]PWN28202.1 hypothetical protein BDZ90DRAFT_239634 [Jaminaea rosea]